MYVFVRVFERCLDGHGYFHGANTLAARHTHCCSLCSRTHAHTITHTRPSGGRRAGTENIILNVGLGAAAELACGASPHERVPEARARLHALRERLREVRARERAPYTRERTRVCTRRDCARACTCAFLRLLILTHACCLVH